MDIQSSVTSRTIPTVSTLLMAHRRSETALYTVVFAAACCLTPLLVLSGVIFGFGNTLSILVVLALAVLIVRWPVVGFYVVALFALVIEQGPLYVNGVAFNFYVFYWPPNLAGLFERPIGFLIIFIFLVLICHRLAARQRPLWGGKLLLPYLFFLLCVAGGVLHGLSSGGDIKIIVEEVRPFWYLFVSYLLAYNLVTDEKHIRALFWIVILSAGLKGLQGLYVYLVVLHGNLVGVNEIMAHEDSFFFVALLLLVVLFCLHHRYRPQFYAALLVMPAVLIALIANQRRADYIALVVGIAVAWAIIFQVNPRARKRLVAGALIFVVLAIGYVAAFANSNGGFGEPARAIASIINPALANARDAASNLYRLIEDFDLKYTVQRNPLGLGFGKPFLEPIPLVDISAKDPLYNYVPHNTIYWVWMRLGPIGYVALWYLFGAIIVRGCLIARQLRERYLQVVAIFITAITFMEIIVAFADYQLFFYRNVIYLGLMAGVLMKLPALDAKKEAARQ